MKIMKALSIETNESNSNEAKNKLKLYNHLFEMLENYIYKQKIINYVFLFETVKNLL